PRLQLGLGARNDEGLAEALAAGRRDEGHRLTELGVVLHVVERRDRQGAPAQAGVRRHVLDALAPQPDLALLVPQPLQILTAHTRRHRPRVPSNAYASSHTFHSRAAGNCRTRGTFLRMNEGWTNWPHGTNGPSSKTITWICSAICLRLAGSVARIQSRRSFSIGGFVGKRDHPPSPP